MESFAEKELGPLPPNAELLKTRLEANHLEPYDALQDHIKQNKASLHIVRVCLFAAYNQTLSLPRSKRRSFLASNHRPIATLALKYIWTDSKLWLPLVQSDYPAQVRLCYFAVHEGLQNAILKWLDVNEPSDSTGQPWRAALLRNLMVGLCVYTSDHRADAALRCFLDFEKWHQDARKTKPHSPAAAMSTMPAFWELMGMLSSGWYFRTDPVLFDAFAKRTKKFGLVHEGVIFDDAKLALFHPKSPDATAALQFFRQLDSDGRFPPHRERERTSFRRTMERAFAVCKAYDHPEDADWIASKYLEVFKQELVVRDPFQRGLPNWEDPYIKPSPKR